jgi:hypothetical protein
LCERIEAPDQALSVEVRQDLLVRFAAASAGVRTAAEQIASKS